MDSGARVGGLFVGCTTGQVIGPAQCAPGSSPELGPVPASCASDAVRMTERRRSAQRCMRPSNSFAPCSTVPHNTIHRRSTFDSADAAARGPFQFGGAVQRYVDDVLSLPVVAARFAPTLLVVRARRGNRPHYENRGGTGTIAVPERAGSDWAPRELRVCPRVAHHLCASGGPAHGPIFVETFCELASLVMGAEVGHVLRVVYARKVWLIRATKTADTGGGMSIGPDDWQPVDELLDRLHCWKKTAR